ncbi:hypothetical protein AAF134_06990 [Synechococcus lacustris Tous-12m]
MLAEGLGPACGLSWLALATLLWPIPLNDLGTVRMLVATGVAVVATLLAGRQRSRAEMLQNSILLTVAALLVEALGQQLQGRPPGGITGGGGIDGGLLLLGLLLAPFVEQLFGLVTRSRLLELSDLQRPLLRKLASEAPGTFEHTLMISSLAEEGCGRSAAMLILPVRDRYITTSANCMPPNGSSKIKAVIIPTNT